MAQISSIRKKNVIRYNGEPCLVIESQIRTPPNMRSFAQMSLRNLMTGKVIHVRTNVGDSYDILPTDIRKLEYSYEAQGDYVFMDPVTFEEFTLNKDLVEDALKYMVPNQSYEVMFVDGKPIVLNLTSTVNMKVIEAPEGLRGDTSGSAQKTVKVETGLDVRTPLFIKTGDVIIINTEDGSYAGRA